ncbi:MAG: SDR family oxidoreductase [Coriobacteriia bacterium]|nr:SDR family oxidoreductase [Coriobacteriia bacterium]
MRVLVTGGFGYLGAQVVRHFHEHGFDVRALDRCPSDGHVAWASQLGVDVLAGDITRPDRLAAAVADVDVVVHAAALNMRACAADPALALQVNALGTRNVLAAAAEAGVARFVYLSTIHVYGSLAGATVDESYPQRPVSDYGVSKLAGEAYCHRFAAAGAIEAVVLRPANGFGPPVFADADCWMLAVNDFCRTAYRTGEIVLLSPGTQRRDFLALSDTVRAIATVATTEALPSDAAAAVLNVGAGISLSIRELASIAAEVCSEVYGRAVTVRLPRGTEALTDDAPVDYRYDLISALGYAPATDMRAGIRAVAEYVAALEG